MKEAALSYSAEVLADSPLEYLRFGDAPPIAAIASSSQFNATTEAAVNAFDGSAATQWTTNGTATGWLRAQLTAATVLTSYKVLGRRDAFPNRSPKDWTFEGSNDASSWTTLDTQSAITWTSGQVRTFTFSNTTAYLYYRINVSANTGDSYLNIPTLALVGVNPGTLADLSGNSRDANVQGSLLAATSLLTGDTDPGGSFDGSTSAVIVPSASALNVSSFTVEAWIKTTKTSDYQYIITRDTQARLWDFRLKPNGNLEFEVITGSGDPVAAVTLNDGARHHVVGTFDGTNIRLYVDGALAQTGAASITNSGTADLSIGAALVGTGSYGIHSFQGTIDEVAYYGTALSGTRIAAHYTAGTSSGSGASGTASLSLSASGTGAAAAGGSAALSLGASGTTAAPISSSAALSLSASGSLDAPTAASGTASLSLTASGTGVAAGTASASLALSASGSVELGAAGTASLQLSADGTATQLFVTDTSNLLNGRDRRGSATVTITRPVAAPPNTLTLAQKVDKAVALPTPTLVDGRPT